MITHWTLRCNGCEESFQAEIFGPRPYRCTCCGLLEGWTEGNCKGLHIETVRRYLEVLDRHFGSEMVLELEPWYDPSFNGSSLPEDEYLIVLRTSIPPEEAHRRFSSFEEWRGDCMTLTDENGDLLKDFEPFWTINVYLA